MNKIRSLDDLLFGYLIAASNKTIDLTNLTVSLEIMTIKEKEIILDNLHNLFTMNDN